MSVPASLYFPPSFFSPFYFPSLEFPTDDPGSGGFEPYQDSDAFRAIVGLLCATNEFSEIVLGGPVDLEVRSGDRSPVVVITPGEWAECDDADPIVVVRRVKFELRIVVRGERTADRLRKLHRLSSVSQNAIDGSDLGGGCLPALTILRRGRYLPHSPHPQQIAELSGEFTYLIPGFQSHTLTN